MNLVGWKLNSNLLIYLSVLVLCSLLSGLESTCTFSLNLGSIFFVIMYRYACGIYLDVKINIGYTYWCYKIALKLYEGKRPVSEKSIYTYINR